jgi:NAD(P)-dependent dehydrogenase (short-subunit alcohol dehydrogenase family)
LGLDAFDSQANFRQYARCRRLSHCYLLEAEQLAITFEAAQAELLRAKTPSLQMVTEEQLAGVFLFLCSSSADQVTGITLPVDGGWTSQ